MIDSSLSTLTALTAVLLCAGYDVQAQQPDDDVVIGQQICTAGYVMDEYCIDNVNLLDASRFKTLENPEEHSVHCLIDVGLCYNTPYHILSEPHPGNESLYGPGWAVSDNTPLMEIGKAVGSCADCDGTGSVVKGLRMEIRGTVASLSPPRVDVLEALYLEGDAQGCLEFASSVSDSETLGGFGAIEEDGGTSEVPEESVEPEVSTSTTTETSSGIHSVNLGLSVFTLVFILLRIVA